MDADFIAVKDMDPIVALLETHDFISYQMEGVPGSEGVSMMRNQKVSMIDSDRHRFGFCMCLTRIASTSSTIACRIRFLNRTKSQTCRRFIEF